MKLPVGYIEKNVFDDFGEIDFELSEQAYLLAKKENIGITSDRELSCVIVDIYDNVVAASWTSFDGTNYEFDIVVDKNHQGKKIGSALIDNHLEIPYEYKEQNPNTTMVLHVVNDKMKKALENRGLSIKENLSKTSCLMNKNELNDPIKQSVKPKK